MRKQSLLLCGLVIALMTGSTLALGDGHDSKGQVKGHGHGKGMHGDPEQRLHHDSTGSP